MGKSTFGARKKEKLQESEDSLVDKDSIKDGKPISLGNEIGRRKTELDHQCTEFVEKKGFKFQTNFGLFKVGDSKHISEWINYMHHW